MIAVDGRRRQHDPDVGFGIKRDCLVMFSLLPLKDDAVVKGNAARSVALRTMVVLLTGLLLRAEKFGRCVLGIHSIRYVEGVCCTVVV